MTKIIEIERCNECPNCKLENVGSVYSKKGMRRVFVCGIFTQRNNMVGIFSYKKIDPTKIPDWCPLPDKE